MKKKIIIIVSSIIAIIIIAIISSIIWYNIGIGPVKEGDTTTYKIEIPIGSTTSSIAEILEENKIINNSLAFKIYAKLNNISNFQAGNYELSKSMDVKELTEILQTGKVNSKDVLSITFVEGKNMKWIAQTIADSTNNSEEDVYTLLQDKKYIDSLIEKYWFITEEIKDENIYYPLEGYFFPDTYEFENKDVSVEKIFETLLDEMKNKLDPYKKDIQNSKYSVHELLTIASIIENEAMFDEDRKDVSSVIYNRLQNQMAIQSDVTTYYALKIDIGSRDLYVSELNTYNPYNTRGPNMQGKLPVGPISMVGLSSIEAAISPNESTYLYFVADKNGKVYFSKTEDEHSKKINELQNSGLWYEF